MISKREMWGSRLVRHTVMPAVLGAWAAFGMASGGARATNITTYHYDTFRTGWNQTETSLTPATVASSAFGLVSQTAVDEQVDAQPLFVAGMTIAGGKHDVVYVATEKNSVYAIDANSGQVLLSQNFGTPVPISVLPNTCNNNSNNVGINSTPVIDLPKKTLYAITYTYENKVPVYRIHAISLTSLQDLTPSVVITATGKQTNGTQYAFNATVQRQRSALVLTSTHVYAGFASFCDNVPEKSHGWLMGWARNTLTPLPLDYLVDQDPTPPNNFFLSSIWMSGYGVAYDGKGSLFFSTGNSNPGGSTYNTKTNLEESVVRMSGSLKSIQSYFTVPNYAALDSEDEDLGGGGVLLLPTQAGAAPNMAVIAGKTGSIYLLNRDKPSGSSKAVATLGTYPGRGCWCGQSYYAGGDGIGRVVSSTGGSISVWKVVTSPAPALSLESNGPELPYGQDPGFMTSISSNGTQANTAVIWAVPHPPTATVNLVAMDPANSSAQIYSAAAGSWPFYNDATANIVPVVANGHVFVASYQQLSIFGLSTQARHVAFQQAATPQLDLGAKHEVRGVVLRVAGTSMQIRTARGSVVNVDFTTGKAAGNAIQPKVGRAVQARGDYYEAGTLMAKSVLRAINKPSLWGPDR